MKRRVFGWCAALLLLPGLAFAQQAIEVPAAPDRNRPAAPEGKIQLDVVVTDKGGKPVPGLELKDFTLLDDKKPAAIVSFHAINAANERGNPVDAIVVLDAVNLGYVALAQMRDEITKFLRQNGGHLALPFSFLLFSDDGVKVLLEPSTDGNSLATGLENAKSTFRTVGRSGGVNGASERLNLSMKWLRIIADNEAKDPRRKLLIWTGPGWPMLDQADTKTSPEGLRRLFEQTADLSTSLRKAHIEVDSVNMGAPNFYSDMYQSYLKGVRSPDHMDPSCVNLKVIAIQSGGKVMSPDNDLVAQLRDCLQDAEVFYELSFDPPRTEQADEYHDLKIVVDKPKLTVRADTGYYNQP